MGRLEVFPINFGFSTTSFRSKNHVMLTGNNVSHYMFTAVLNRN